MKHKIPAVLFAGGKSSRMGRDKALLPFAKNNTLSEFQYNRLHTLFEKVYISAKENKFDFQADIISDNYEESSPLVGIVSVFETLAEDEIFILSVDAPFVDASVIDTLIQSREKHDVTVARTASGSQPLCGIYKRSVLSAALKNLKENEHKLGNLLKKVDTKFIYFEEEAAFINLNHPHEYEEAVKSIESSNNLRH